nr:LamG-like jellyroll fold domain-containing protein [uncultured Flavobacterium sp.]
MLFLNNTSIIAQTVLISPTGDGGFELGTTFASNGWTEVNGTNNNRVWYVGTGQVGYTGSRCAFIGNDATTVGNNDKARTVHIYKSITIPAGATNINLSFKYKQATADYNSPTYYDFISVYTDNNTPTNGNIPAGALQFGPYPNSDVISFTTQNTTLPNSLAGTTTNLIFTFKCDNANPNGYGAIDDISLTFTPLVSSPPSITSLGTTSGCEGSSITINGTNLTGATAANVTIGGTAVSSITSNTGTQIVAVIGSGTTGTVSVTTAGGTTTSAATFTVNPLPGQPSTITGNTSPCSGSSQVYSVTNVSGLTYTWTFPSGWTQTAGGTTNSVTVTTNGNSGTISVTPSNGCAGLPSTLSVTPTSVPAQPSTITGSTTPCVGTSQTYSVTNAPGTDYAWTFPLGWTQTGGGTTNSVTVTTNGTSGTIQVTPSNGCGSGTSQTLATTVNSLPTTANAGTDQTLAACATTATLAANTPTVGTGSWTVVSGTATITTPSSATTGVTGLIVGTTATLRWTISNGGCSTSTDDVVITTVIGSGCLSYCTPTYSTGSGSGNSITNVTLGTLNNTTGASSNPYYTFYNAVTIPNLAQAATASVSITFASQSNQYAAVWIDFNQNYTFEVNEGAVSVANTGANGTTTITIPVPEGALTGNTRMRVRGGDNNALFTSQACGASNNGNGETEDYIVNITPTATLTNGPGGVMSNLQLWFRSDLLNGTTTVPDNTNVNTWNTQARGTNATVNTSGQEPKYYNNAAKNINFNAVVDFTNDYNNAPFDIDYTYKPQQYLQGTSGYYTQDMFVVVLPDTPILSTNESMDIFCGDSPDAAPDARDGSGIGFGKYTVRTDDEVISYAISTTSTTTVPEDQRGYGIAQTGTTITYNNVGIINTRNNSGVSSQELYYNALNISNKEVGIPKFTNLNDTRYWIGRSQAFRGSLDGRVGEIITYSSRLNNSERSNVQSYLAIKYGITLGLNGTSINYTNSDGNIIWNINTGTTANDVFNYDIAGIGRDDIAKLNQKQSKTVNTADDITIGLTDIAITNTANTNTFDTNKKFLVWGNNHGTLAAQPSVIINMSSGITPTLTTNVEFVSVGRTWKVVETGGNIPTTKVSIPTIMLSATLTPPGDYLMFISSTPNFDPTAEYRIMRVNGSNLETDYDFDGTKYITFGFAPERTYVRSIAFDGTDDYLDAGKVLNLNTSFTVSSWIKRNSTNQTILSKRDIGFTTGYDLSINSDGEAEMSWMNGSKQAITSSVVIPSGIWHNIAVTYDGTTSTAKLYIDGVLNVTNAMPNVPANTQSFLIAAADGVNTTSFFNGNIDEVRVWNVALTDKQLRYVMNQEILSNGLATNGSIIPNSITLNDISSIPWSNLSAYYPMSTYTYTNAKDISNNNYTAALRNLITVDRQTAPLPYESIADGPWSTNATWKNNTVQDLPNSPSLVNSAITVDWNIVKTSHDVTSSGNKTVLGLMLMNDTKKITASNDSKIEITNYLKLDGKIDLQGMSQLVQTLDCDLDVTSKGSIERDQQGQANRYNYNYWCSPVSPITPIAPFLNNNDYTVAGIMKDGTTAIPQNITWIGGYDGAASTPISIARYWLYTFDNKVNDYANWNKITESSLIRVGLGFTMKGSGTTGTQNYTFVGKPNNGLINSNTVAKDQLLLTGNPYPSALDAKKFIEDNAGSIDGNLYFWEHYSTNNTHVLKDYQGGYATLNLVGGVPSGSIPTSVDVDYISGLGSPSKGAPKQFIPVGQGFFVNGSGTGGTIVINNNQRYFARESDSNSNILYKTRPKTSKTAQIDHWNDNSNDIIQKDNYKRIRLGFNANNNYHRQVLLGFMDEKATSGMDYGYDGIGLDELPNDMYFLNGENQLVIQGEGYFNEDASYPIGIKTTVEGKVSLTIDALENFDSQQKVYIYDEQEKTYNEIQKNAFEVNLPAGVNNTRFSLRFKDKSLSTEKTLSVAENNAKSNEIEIAHIQNSNTLKIANKSTETTVEKVTLFNIAGQSIATWKIENQDQQNIQIPIKTVSTGVYIAKLNTTSGEVSKKLIIK